MKVPSFLRAHAGVLAILVLAGCTNPEISTRTTRSDEETFGRSHQERPHPPTERAYESVRLDVEIVEVSQADAPAFESLWREGVDLTIPGGGAKDAWAKNGMQIGLGGSKFPALFAAAIQQSKGRTSSEISLTAVNGRPAVLPVGEMQMESVSLVVWNAAAVSQTLSVSRSALQFEITPTILDESRLRVEIQPRLSHHEDAAKMATLREMAATMTVRDGTPIVMGRFGAEAQTLGTTFLRAREGSSLSTMWVVVTPRLVR